MTTRIFGILLTEDTWISAFDLLLQQYLTIQDEKRQQNWDTC